MRAIEHAENELRAGRLWRAKEVLQGSLRNGGYDVELFEKLGSVVVVLILGVVKILEIVWWFKN